MTRYRLTPTDPSMAAEGYALFRDAYLRARRANPLLPALTQDHEARLRQRVERAFVRGGFAVWHGDSLRGFMAAGAPFAFRGSTAALVPEYGHAAAEGEETALVGPLYAAVAERLAGEGVQLHLIGHFAADAVTTSSLFELGFGAIVRERLRDLSDVAVPDAAHSEHDAWLAYLIVGRCPAVTDGRLLGETATAQVRSAFVVPAARRGGIGGALLQQAVAWTRDAGFERLFVEHETANLPGAAFWRRHFEPYLVFSMRYVDRTA